MVTAAHCVYDINESHQYVDSLDFKPGLDGSSAPYGTLRWKTARILSQFTSQVLCLQRVYTCIAEHRHPMQADLAMRVLPAWHVLSSSWHLGCVTCQ